MSRGLSATWRIKSVASDGSPGGGHNFGVGEHFDCKTTYSSSPFRSPGQSGGYASSARSPSVEGLADWTSAACVPPRRLLCSSSEPMSRAVVKIIAPAEDAMFMHDRPDHRRDIALSTVTSPRGRSCARQHFLCVMECTVSQSEVWMTPHLSDGGCFVVLGAFVRSTHPTLEFPLMPDSPSGVISSTGPLTSTILWAFP